MPRQVHHAVLDRHATQPFQSVVEIYAFVYTYAAKLSQASFNIQKDMLFNFKRLIKLPCRGVVEVVGAINPWEPKPVLHCPQWEN
jgi:hypothetical protein